MAGFAGSIVPLSLVALDVVSSLCLDYRGVELS